MEMSFVKFPAPVEGSRIYRIIQRVLCIDAVKNEWEFDHSKHITTSDIKLYGAYVLNIIITSKISYYYDNAFHSLLYFIMEHSSPILLKYMFERVFRIACNDNQIHLINVLDIYDYIKKKMSKHFAYRLQYIVANSIFATNTYGSYHYKSHVFNRMLHITKELVVKFNTNLPYTIKTDLLMRLLTISWYTIYDYKILAKLPYPIDNKIIAPYFVKIVSTVDIRASHLITLDLLLERGFDIRYALKLDESLLHKLCTIKWEYPTPLIKSPLYRIIAMILKMAHN